MYGPKPHSSLVHMHKHEGVELLYGNDRTLCVWGGGGFNVKRTRLFKAPINPFQVPFSSM